MDISVIIVTWNSAQHISACIQSIITASKDLHTEILVIDNASSDTTINYIQKFPLVRCISNTSNQGYARACNTGLRQAHGKYVFVLNPDTELDTEALNASYKYMEQHPEVALISPRIVNADASFQRSSIRRNPTPLSQFLLFWKLDHLVPHLSIFRSYYWDNFDPEKEQHIPQVMGAAMFGRRSALEHVDFFDERFFIWFEDVDLCLRLQKACLTIKYIPQARVRHSGRESFKLRHFFQKQLWFGRSMLYYFYKNHGLLSSALLAIGISPILTLSYLGNLAYGTPGE